MASELPESSSTNPGAEAFKNVFGRLVEAIQDPLVLASELYSKGIIPEAVVSKVLPGTGLTDCEKNAIVLRAVSSRLRTFPSDFEQLLDVLEKSSALSRDHAVQLRQAYDAIQQSQKSMRRQSEQKSTQKVLPPQPLTVTTMEKVVACATESGSDVDLCAQLNLALRSIQNMFGQLLFSTRESLKAKELKPASLVTCVLDLAHISSDRQTVTAVLRDKADELREADSIDEVFTIISASSYWSFFNYDLLKHIIKTCDVDQTCLSEYTEAFEEFCRRKIAELPPAALKCESGNGSKKDKVVVKVNISHPTLNSICNAIERIAQILNVPASALQANDIRPGSVVVEFLVPQCITQQLFPLTEEQKHDLYHEARVLKVCWRDTEVVDLEAQFAQTAKSREVEVRGEGTAAGSKDSRTEDELPRPKDVISLKWRDESGKVKVYKLREALSPHWKDLGKVFGFHESLLVSFEKHRGNHCEECFDDVLSEWRSNGSVPPGSYPVTWGGLIGALRNLGRMGHEVDKLSSALSNRVEEEEGAGREGSIQTEGHTSLKGFLNSALKKSFVLLIFDLVAILTKESEALLRITTALEHAPDVLFDTKCIEEAKSVADVFRYLRQFWSHTECELLSFVVEASCCEAATARLQEFLSFREENAEHIIIHPSQPSPPSPGAQTPPPSEHTPPHRAPTTPPFKQAPPTSPHEASASDRVEHPRIAIIVASVDTDVLTQKDYNAISDAIRSVLSLQKHVLVFDGTEEGDTEDGSNQLKWRVNADSIQIDQVSDSHLKELQEQHVNGLTSTVGKNAYEFINSKA